mmetsp:Transcript_125562/g.280472  ORF Transcript_125562/g.280472 Transcript_125562/m.280472 type:complete len:330 (-) Transcript_125562:103-1092(-)
MSNLKARLKDLLKVICGERSNDGSTLIEDANKVASEVGLEFTGILDLVEQAEAAIFGLAEEPDKTADMPSPPPPAPKALERRSRSPPRRTEASPPTPIPSTKQWREDTPSTGTKQWREGDWVCSFCSAHNFASKLECFKCHRQPVPEPQFQQATDLWERSRGAGCWPAPEEAPWTPAPRTSAPRTPASSTPDNSKWRDGDWSCPDCFNHNWKDRTECNKCGSPRPHGGHQQGPRLPRSLPHDPNFEIRRFCKYIIQNSGCNSGKNCGFAHTTADLTIQHSEGMWVCHKCGGISSAQQAHCFRCKEAWDAYAFVWQPAQWAYVNQHGRRL